MDRKAFFVFLLVLMVLIFGEWQVQKVAAEAPAAGVSAEAKAGSGNLDVIILNNQGYKKKRKGPVKFTHKMHVYEYRVFCWECHHNYVNGEDIWVPWGETKKCSRCHDPKKKEPNEIMLQKAFHYQCKGCHKSLAKKMMKTGAYRKCGGCHLKKEAQ